MKYIYVLILSFGFIFIKLGCQGYEQNLVVKDGALVIDEELVYSDDEEHDHEHSLDELGDFENLFAGDVFTPYACTKATAAQLAQVNEGNKKYEKFLAGCYKANNNSSWCTQLTRPNPSSKSTFVCTYGANQLHRLIHPDETTWSHAYNAVKLVRELEGQGISVAQIYNWWRPAPYNGNVGGAAGRHPFGTSVDVRFSTKKDMERAHAQLCKWRSQGRLRALGYYGTTALHFGMGDKTANTWGKSCP